MRAVRGTAWIVERAYKLLGQLKLYCVFLSRGSALRRRWGCPGKIICRLCSAFRRQDQQQYPHHQNHSSTTVNNYSTSFLFFGLFKKKSCFCTFPNQKASGQTESEQKRLQVQIPISNAYSWSLKPQYPMPKWSVLKALQNCFEAVNVECKNRTFFAGDERFVAD